MKTGALKHPANAIRGLVTECGEWRPHRATDQPHGIHGGLHTSHSNPTDDIRVQRSDHLLDGSGASRIPVEEPFTNRRDELWGKTPYGRNRTGRAKFECRITERRRPHEHRPVGGRIAVC